MSSSGRASWSKRIDALRQEGKYQQALELARHAYGEAPQSTSVKRSYGWAIYTRIKAHVDGFFTSLSDQSPEAKQQRSSAQIQIDFLLREYAEAQLPKKDLCLSLLLSQATRLRTLPQCLPIVLAWVKVDGLRVEDTSSVEGAHGKLYPSLLEKLAERLAQIAIETKDPKSCFLALSWIEAAQTRAAPLIHPERFSNQRGPLLRLSGQIDQAVSYAKIRLSHHPRDAHAWREWSLCERTRDPKLSLWLGVRAALEARSFLSLKALTLWAEHLALIASDADEKQSALALGIWSIEQRAIAGVARHDQTLYLTRSLGGKEALEMSLKDTLTSLDQRAQRLSEQALNMPKST